jgi:hypothetical protein
MQNIFVILATLISTVVCTESIGLSEYYAPEQIDLTYFQKYPDWLEEMKVLVERHSLPGLTPSLLDTKHMKFKQYGDLELPASISIQTNDIFGDMLYGRKKEQLEIGVKHNENSGYEKITGWYQTIDPSFDNVKIDALKPLTYGPFQIALFLKELKSSLILENGAAEPTIYFILPPAPESRTDLDQYKITYLELLVAVNIIKEIPYNRRRKEFSRPNIIFIKRENDSRCSRVSNPLTLHHNLGRHKKHSKHHRKN